MRFEMWSFWHLLYILSPFIILPILYFSLRNKSEKTRYIVGVVIGAISLFWITARNISILVSNGFDAQAIPLQVCHFGNIVVFIALVFKSKIATSMAWMLNLLAAFSSLIVADALGGYSTIWEIRAQAYIWGHLFIVIGAIYPIMMKLVRIDLKSYIKGYGVLAALLVVAIIMNSVFNNVLGFNVNYFYIFDSHGVPFGFIYDWGTMVHYGWFSINWVYTISLIFLCTGIFALMYYIQKLFYLKDKNFETQNIFIQRKVESKKQENKR